MKHFWTRPERLLDALVLGLAVPTIAIAAGMTGAEYNAAKDRATANYKAAVARCDTVARGPERDVCVADAKAAEKRAKAEADAAYKNTDKARRDARLQIANADYDAAKAHCRVKRGNEQDVCMAEAKAAAQRAQADAKAQARIADAQHDAADEKRKAAYKVAAERCDALAGAEKTACLSEAKARYQQ